MFLMPNLTVDFGIDSCKLENVLVGQPLGGVYDKVRKCKQWRGGCSHLVALTETSIRLLHSLKCSVCTDCREVTSTRHCNWLSERECNFPNLESTALSIR